MKSSEEITTVAETIIWIARERMKTERFQNINSAIHATGLEISNKLMDFMKDEK